MLSRFVVGLVLFLVGCSSTVDVKGVKINQTPEFSKQVVDLQVDLTRNNQRQEAVALDTGLRTQLVKAGYRIEPGNLKMMVAITDLGIKETADVDVKVDDSKGQNVMSFSVSAAVVDRRYRDLNEVLQKFVAKQIVKELKKARDGGE